MKFLFDLKLVNSFSDYTYNQNKWEKYNGKVSSLP